MQLIQTGAHDEAQVRFHMYDSIPAIGTKLYTSPPPDHRDALLRQALEALELSRDDVNECLNEVLPKAGWERFDKRIAAFREQLVKHDAAIAAIRKVVK